MYSNGETLPLSYLHLCPRLLDCQHTAPTLPSASESLFYPAASIDKKHGFILFFGGVLDVLVQCLYKAFHIFVFSKSSTNFIDIDIATTLFCR